MNSNCYLLLDPTLVIDKFERGDWTVKFSQAYSSIRYLHVVVHMGPAEAMTFFTLFLT